MTRVASVVDRWSNTIRLPSADTATLRCALRRYHTSANRNRPLAASVYCRSLVSTQLGSNMVCRVPIFLSMPTQFRSSLRLLGYCSMASSRSTHLERIKYR